MDLLNILKSVAPAPSNPLNLEIKPTIINTSSLEKVEATKEIKEIKNELKNDLLKNSIQETDTLKYYQDDYGNTHMIAQKNDPLQVYGKQNKVQFTTQPIRIDHKTVVDVEEIKKWTIPPCVSNYKNPQGFVIPLDKRMANQPNTSIKLNDKFGEMANALYDADHKMKEKLENRRQNEQKILLQQQKLIEDELESLVKNKQIIAGDKRTYDEFQQEHLDNKFKKKKKKSDDVDAPDIRLQFNSTTDTPKEKLNDLLNQNVRFEKDKK